MSWLYEFYERKRSAIYATSGHHPYNDHANILKTTKEAMLRVSHGMG